MIEKFSGYRDAAADGGSSQLRLGRSGKIRSYRPGKDREPPRRCFSVVSFGR